MWHSLITIRSNHRVCCNRLMNVCKSSTTADSGVTNTIIVPPGSVNAGNMNNILLPPSWASPPPTALPIFDRPQRRHLHAAELDRLGPGHPLQRGAHVHDVQPVPPHGAVLLRLILHGDRLRLPIPGPNAAAAANPQNRCQSVLDNRNMAQRRLVVSACSVMPRAYTIPAKCDECAACKSAMWLIHCSSSMPSSPRPRSIPPPLIPAPPACCWRTRSTASNCWTNGNTNHKYHTINSPTSCGTYRWMVFTSLLA
ncbi:uncharacterized protein BDW43DRAFT_81126 [Aspergillus alliaceus]|uniref:uncharacterized protein n=1 Tax=Petromyces alliaceus TaxID=209559 RepID=UPI0012A77532|nr:uncharacterized protein BDW43DRAFT_81126 [Aspergillus alliaceus]KAB8226795.1 hypothetical protein BDW43DRAFT_81126 [Aspergillus alliaceus]